MTETDMPQRSPRKTGLTLGLLYIAMSVPAAIDLMFIRRALISPGDAEATAMNLLGGELFFRVGIALQLTTGILALVLATYYYGVFADVSRSLARLLVLFVLGGTIFEMSTGALGALALTYVRQPDYLMVFEAEQLNASAQAILSFQNFGYTIAHIFWGLWLLPLGLLVIRSRGAPKAVALLLVLAGVAYVAGGFLTTLLPAYARSFVFWAMIPEGIGEIGFVLWVMIFGFRTSDDGVSSVAPDEAHAVERV